mgnify:CR=1 FL=1
MQHIDYARHLNAAQLEAVETLNGPVLVIAGAGSGKTRTVVYRLARLVESGVAPESILLLTFTRKAANEMLNRAAHLAGQGLHGVAGGTFHAFAFGMLRRFGQRLGYEQGVSIMDRADAEGVVKQVREGEGVGKGDRSFPRKGAVLSLLSKARNKERALEDILAEDAGHLLPHAEGLQLIQKGYEAFKAKHGLLDYDDLLFKFEALLREHEDIREFLLQRYSHLMIDEFQDTNLVQGRLVRLLTGTQANVMAVGDDAQSVYAFRGATVENILQFTADFPGAKVIKLEQNYRSTQPILELTNQILAQATAKYEKHLFSERTEGPKPQVVRPLSDMTQAQGVVDKIVELSRTTPRHEIAVLFRAGYQSYPLEVALNKIGVEYQKFGGMRFAESAHIKDFMAHLRLVANPADLPAWQRALSILPGVGPKTCERIYEATLQGDEAYMARICKRIPELENTLTLLDNLRQGRLGVGAIIEQLLDYYRPFMEERYPDDFPKRQAGLEELAQIAAGYKRLEDFLADMSLDNPDTNSGQGVEEDKVVLSTIHSAKGLEWSAVLLIDLVEDRFPSRHALARPEDMEEERRLMYVACTRARDVLGLYVPDTVFKRNQGSTPVMPSPFVQELPAATYEEWQEGYAGGFRQQQAQPAPAPKEDAQPAPPDNSGATAQPSNGYCYHKIFGRGKILSFIPPNKYKVNFSGFGIKTMISDYLQMEES